VDETAVIAVQISDEVFDRPVKSADEVALGPDAARLQAVVTLDSRDVQTAVRL
jgi:hypothetical protein